MSRITIDRRGNAIGRKTKSWRLKHLGSYNLQSILIFAILFLFAPINCVSECEKAAYVGLTHDQKVLLCAESGAAIGPALCSIAAKGLHFSSKEIVSLCKGAVGTSPAECLLAIPSRFRKVYGMKLCPSHITTAVPGKCFATITSGDFKGASAIKPPDAANFCENLDEEGPVACMQAIVESGIRPQLLNANMGLQGHDGCLNSTLYYSKYIPGETGRLVRDLVTGKPYNTKQKRSVLKAFLDTFQFWKSSKTSDEGVSIGSTEGKRLAISACLQELKHALTSSAPRDYRLRPDELLRFCMHTSVLSLAPSSAKENYFLQGHRLESVKYSKTGAPEYFHSYAAECVVHAIELSERGKSIPLFNSSHRLQLCEDVDCRNGPLNCARTILEKGDSKDAADPEALITLCNGACGIDHESSRNIRYEARHEEHRIQRSRSRNKKVRLRAEREAFTNLYLNLAESSKRLGLGPALCYNEAMRSIKSAQEKVDLCVGAESAGPAHCYGRTRAIPQLNSHKDKLDLCVGAQGEEPALCVSEAPGYLELEERIQLCAGAKSGIHTEPVTCLKRVEGPSKLLKDAPKRSVGAMLGMLRGDPDSLRARELLVHMCSFGASINPLASAACLKSAPLQLTHDDAVRACTNVSNSEVLSKVSLCAKLLPVDWSFTQATKLCAWEPPMIIDPDNENATIPQNKNWDQRNPNKVSATHTTVQCALEVSRQQIYSEEGRLGYWTKEEVSELCKKENEAGSVRKCALAVQPTGASSASHNAQFLSASMITSVCDEAKDEGPGRCLTRLNILTSQRKVTFAPGEDVAEEICASEDPAFVMSCLDDVMRKSNVLSSSHVEGCFSQPRRIDKADIKAIRSVDGAPFTTAGMPFSLTVALFDQFGTEFEPLVLDGDGSEEDDPSDASCGIAGKILFVSLNEGNDQGAVLWGIRSNKTTCYQLHFSNLVISQPGEVQIKISYAVGSAEAKESNAGSLTLFYLNVLPDPVFGTSTGICTFIFREGMTGLTELPPAAAVFDDDGESGAGKSASAAAGPLIIRSYLPAYRYLKVMYCRNIMEKWHVSLYEARSGFWIEYRNGVDAIWTGRNLPVYEQTFEERLGLPSGLIEEAMELTADKFREIDENPREMDATAAAVGSGAANATSNKYNSDNTNSYTMDNSSTTSAPAKEAATGKEEYSTEKSDSRTEAEQEEDNTDDEVIARIEAEEEKEARKKRASKAETERELLMKQYDIDARYSYSQKCNVSLEELNRTVNGTISQVAIEKCQLNAQESEEERAKREEEKEAWLEKMRYLRERSENRTREAERVFKLKQEAIAFERSTFAAKKKKLVKMERNAQKILRKAYYAKSIRWHPDRWVGLNTYADVVRETFEAITEAYDGLQAMITRLSKQNLEEFMKREETIKKQKSGEGGSEREDAKDEGQDAAIIPEEPKTPSSNPELFS